MTPLSFLLFLFLLGPQLIELILFCFFCFFFFFFFFFFYYFQRTTAMRAQYYFTSSTFLRITLAIREKVASACTFIFQIFHLSFCLRIVHHHFINGIFDR